MIDQVGTGKNIKYEWSDPDRFFAGIKLIKNNKSKLLILLQANYLGLKNWRPEGVI